MKRTNRLGLPIFDNPTTDKFGLDEWNYANETIDEAYDEIDNIRKEIPKVNANAELVEARMGKATLGDKMKEVSTSLEQKANKDGIFTMANMGQDVKTAMTGGSVAVVGKSAILSENIVDNQILERNVSFINQYSKNLFDKDYVTSGVINESGAITVNVSYVHSDYIKVNAGDKVTISKAYTVGGCAYDGNKNPISKPYSVSEITKPFTFTVPNNVAYIKFNIGIAELNTFVVCKGETIIEYEKSNYKLQNKILIDKAQIQNLTIDKGECSFINTPLNLFDKTKISTGVLLDTGIIDETKTSYCVSDFIKVGVNEKITVSKGYTSFGCVYDKNKNLISPVILPDIITPYTLTVLNNEASYIRVNLEKSILDSYMFIKGLTLPNSYEAYKGYKLNDDIKISKDNFLVGSISKWNSKKCVTFGDSITWYDKQVYNTNTKEYGVKVKGYQSYLEEELGLIINNQGVSGNTTPQVCTRIKAFDFSGYDLITIMSGTNDFRDRVTEQIGEIQQIGSAFNEGTFIGAYQSMIESILSRFPKIRIQIFTPFMVWQNNIVMQETYINAIKSVGDLYGIPVLDLYHNSGINSLNKSEFIVDDTSKVTFEFHPSTKGYERLSLNCIVPFVNNN